MVLAKEEREWPSQLIHQNTPNLNQKQPTHSPSCFKFFLKKITVLRDYIHMNFLVFWTCCKINPQFVTSFMLYKAIHIF